jgi:hypothetical protein
MESFLSVALGELVTRSINFIINKFSKPPTLAMEESLQRTLLRAQVIDEEAMGRHIPNQAMIQQLGMLRDAMHRGSYALDAFRYKPHYGEDDSVQVVSGFMSLSKLPFAKDPYFFSRTAQSREQLQEALDRLGSMIVDLNELVMFLASYPRLHRQPYSMHILLGNCMFGRQVEAELVINFLLHTQPHSSEELEVLPIIGPCRVGKSTLVAHVCKDERVQDHFSEILWLNDLAFTDDERAFRQGYAMEHQNQVSNWNKDKRSLVVIELSGNLHEDAWNRFYLACKRSFCSGSKIVVTSSSDRAAKFGTAQALALKHLSHEAYWYFFKTLAFGSMDPETHPRLAQVAMEIARTQNRSINAAYIICYLMRNNFNIHFWCKVLRFFRVFVQKHVSRFGTHPYDLLNQNRPIRISRMGTASEYFTIHRQYHCSSQEEVPKIRVHDVVYGSMKTCGKFEVLSWRSPIPPYYSYVNTYEIQERRTTSAKRKRSMEDGATFC